MNHFVYLQRTNCPEGDPARFWQWYIRFQQAGAAFRTSKSDCGCAWFFISKQNACGTVR
jgi:hypothetical protein